MSTPNEPKKFPFLSPLMAMLESRKGIMVLVVVVACMIAVYVGKTQFSEIKEFLTAVMVTYFGAQAYEDAKRNQAQATNPIDEKKP